MHRPVTARQRAGTLCEARVTWRGLRRVALLTYYAFGVGGFFALLTYQILMLCFALLTIQIFGIGALPCFSWISLLPRLSGPRGRRISLLCFALVTY